MGQPISSKMRAIRDPQNMMGTRAVTPHVQLAERYGGKAALREALDEARLRLQPENMKRMEMIDPSYQDYFPEIDYDNYDRPIDVGPMEGMAGTETGQLIRPEDQDGNLVQLASGMFDDMGGPLERPMIGFDPAMDGINDAMTAIGLPEEGNTAALARRQMGIERPMSEAILGDSPDFGLRNEALTGGLGSYENAQSLPGDMQMAMTPSEIDKTLMAIRRADGRTDLSMQEANELINNAPGQAMEPGGMTMGYGDRGGMGQGTMNIDTATGSLVKQLMALQNLPPEVRARLPGRLRTLFSAGGAAAGMGQGGQQQGPLSGLME